MPPSPFQQLLGSEFAILPEPVHRLHGLAADAATEGRADIVAAKGFWPWLICRLAGFPAPGQDVPVTVAFRTDGQGGEFWCRRFAGRRYQVVSPPGADAMPGCCASGSSLLCFFIG